MTDRPKVCPICGHVFLGNGWDGIDAHWRAHHKSIMPYEKAWPLIQATGNFEILEHDDPEASFRRGYYFGAYDALEAVKGCTTGKIQEWLEVKLVHWRYLDRPRERYIKPPLP